MAASAPTDDLDGHKLNPIPRLNERQQHFRLDLEVICPQGHTRPDLEIDQPKAALGVWEKLPGAFGKAAAHPAIDLASEPGDGLGIVHAIADDQLRVGLLRTPEKTRHILRLVLPIAVHGQAPLASARERRGQASLECRAFAKVPRMIDHCRTCRRSQGRGVIGRTVVHDHDEGYMLAQFEDQGRDAGALVETRDYHRASRRSKHVSSLSQPPPGIEAKPARAATSAYLDTVGRNTNDTTPSL